MNTYNNLPLFEISIDGIDLGMTAISIVDDPAVEKDFICFKNESPIHFTSDSEHCITGVAIIADKPIYRRNGAYEYYVVFTKDVIKQIVEQYSREKLWNTVDLQHDGKHIGGVTMVEMYIKNSERGINPAGFEDVAEGSLFVTFKIEDESLWNDIVNGDALNGFSIEIYADMFKMEDSMDISVDSLLGDKKKVNFVSEDALNSLMKKKGVANLGVGNGTLKNAQIHSIGTQNGNRVAVIYADNPYGQKQWYIQPLEGIKTVKPVNVTPVEYNYNLPSFKSIQNVMDNITIDKTEIAQSNDFRSLITGRKWVMINYNDEMEGAKTGARQCMVVAWGISMAGNECIRIYERFGASRHDDVSPIPNYRMLLTSRIINLRVIDYMEPWNDSDLDGRYNWAGDDGMSTVYEWYH